MAQAEILDKVKVFIQNFYEYFHVESMNMTGTLDCQVDVHSRDKLQEVNIKVYQVRRDLCVETFEPHLSTLLDELKRVCHLTILQIDIVWNFKLSYGHNKFATNFQLTIPAVQISFPVKSVFGSLHYVFTIPENILTKGTNQVKLYRSGIISLLVKSKSEGPQYYSWFQVK